MGSSFSAEKFIETCGVSSAYGLLYFYGLSTIFAVIAIEIMRSSQGWHNLALILLLLNILLYSIASFALIYLALYQHIDGNYLDALQLAFCNFCHWIVTIVYIKTSIETRMLLNKDTYVKSAYEMVSVRNFRCYVTTANIFASILIIAISATMCLALFFQYPKLFSIAYSVAIFFRFLCSVAWAWTLIRLYKDIKHSEKLLPNKRVFFIHGSLLTLYYLI